MPATVKGVTLVFAHWCPHCDPPGLEAARRMGDELGVPVKLLDIDVREQEQEADRIVKEHGDWTADYKIPQLFIESSDGTVEHVFTGISEGVAATKRGLEELFNSQWYRELAKSSPGKR